MKKLAILMAAIFCLSVIAAAAPKPIKGKSGPRPLTTTTKKVKKEKPTKKTLKSGKIWLPPAASKKR